MLGNCLEFINHIHRKRLLSTLSSDKADKIKKTEIQLDFVKVFKPISKIFEFSSEMECLKCE